MHKKTLAVIAITLSLLQIVGARQKENTDSEVKQIRAVLDEQVVAWNKGDLEAFMKGYWKSADLTFFSGGTMVSGWQQTLDRYNKRYKSAGNEMGTLDFNDLKIEILGPKAAFVRGRFHLKMSTGDQQGIFTLTFKKFADEWRIIHDHTSTN
jgi:ketosteroid isomerase-like protein